MILPFSPISPATPRSVTDRSSFADFPTLSSETVLIADPAPPPVVAASPTTSARLASALHLSDVGEAGRPPLVLVVDDEATNRLLLDLMLQPLGCRIAMAADGLAAQKMLEQAIERGDELPDLVISDVVMPGLDGVELSSWMKAQPSLRLVPLVMITAASSIEEKLRALEAGADDFLAKPVNRLELLTKLRNLLRVKRLTDQLEAAENVLISLTATLEAKDHYTDGHSIRVAGTAVRLGEAFGLRPLELRTLHLGGLLHDIGKIGVPDRVLNKTGALDDDEWTLMRAHPEIGYRICQPLRSAGQAASDRVPSILSLVRHHHEKLDGSGYPDRLKGDNLPLGVRILTVADIYDGLSTDRAYRARLTPAHAFGILDSEVAKGWLDGDVVGALSADLMA